MENMYSTKTSSETGYTIVGNFHGYLPPILSPVQEAKHKQRIQEGRRQQAKSARHPGEHCQRVSFGEPSFQMLRRGRMARTQEHAAILQGSAKLSFPRLVNFVPAVAYRFCLNMSSIFSQPGNSNWAELCTIDSKFDLPVWLLKTINFSH